MGTEANIDLRSGRSRLFAVLHAPSDPPGCCVLMCYPLFEERKSAGRVFVETARALCAAGCAVLRFDYRGCGDSEGRFEDVTARDWLDDIDCAAGELRTRYPSARLGLLGLRLGATLANSRRGRSPAPDWAILWQPVANPEQHLSGELRKKLMKEMLTFGRSRVSREALLDELRAGRRIDFDGYRLTPELFRSLQDLPAGTAGRPAAGRVLEIDIGPPGTAPGAHSHAAVEHMHVSERPFWNLIGVTQCPSLIDATVAWVCAAQA